MNQNLIILFSIVLSHYSFGQELNSIPENISESIGEFVSPIVTNKDFEGYILIEHQDEVILSESFGLQKDEFTHKTPFLIGSVTKTFTAEIIRSLSEKGLLSYSDNLAKVLPKIQSAENISIQNLLMHTSGIPDYYALNEFNKLRKQKMSLKQFGDWISMFPLDFEPGQRNAYSNSGYNILALMIEETTGKSFSQNLSAEILKPLGMTSTGSLEAGTPKNLPAGFEPGNSPELLRASKKIAPNWLTGSGSIYSTPEDLLIWCKKIRESSNNSEASPRYGWGIRRSASGNYLEQNGRVPGFSSNIRIYPESNVSIIVLSRIESDAVNLVAEGVSRILFGRELERQSVREFPKVSVGELSNYQGVYQITPSFFVTVAIDNGGLAISSGRGTDLNFAVLSPLGKDRFFFRTSYTNIRFAKSEDGKATGLYWGGSGPFPKIEEGK